MTSTNFSRMFVGPYSLYLADASDDAGAARPVPYLDFDNANFPSSVQTGTTDDDWFLIGSGLQSPDGVTITPQLNSDPVYIGEYDAPVALLYSETGLELTVALREVTPEVYGRLMGQPRTTVAAAGNNPKYIETSLASPRSGIAKVFSLYLAGRSVLTSGGSALWIPRASVSEIGDIAFNPEDPTELEVTFLSMEHPLSGHGKFLMQAP